MMGYSSKDILLTMWSLFLFILCVRTGLAVPFSTTLNVVDIEDHIGLPLCRNPVSYVNTIHPFSSYSSCTTDALSQPI